MTPRHASKSQSTPSDESAKPLHRQDALPQWIHPAMFYLAITFLLILSTLLVLWIYLPIVVEPAGAEDGGETTAAEVVQLTEEELRLEAAAYSWGVNCAIAMLILWPVFVTERLVDRLSKFRNGVAPARLWWLGGLIPPLRLCARRERIGTQETEIWFPVAGWKIVDRKLQRELERAFSLPMIGMALLILPILGIQLYFASAKHNIIDYPALRFALNFGTGLIWFAFTTEFIVMVSVAERKLAYCKKNWLDLIIILLPLVSFLRSFSALRATKLAKLGKLQQLSKLVRAYRLRGVSMRALRALMLLEVIHRLLRTKPEKRIKRLEAQVLEKQREIDLLHEEIERIRATKKTAA